MRVEPGVFGIRQPVLLLPEGITERLTPAQLAAIVSHEMCHVRRRDNLTAAMHMLVEVLFWFYPLVWWIRERLIEEREHACDEEVLRSGCDAPVYAEGILNVCKLYVESPLVCASGVTGSDLRKRIENILSNRTVQNLNIARKLLLLIAPILAVTVPVGIGLMNVRLLQSQTSSANRPAFEVASVKAYKDAGIGPRNAHSTYSPEGVDFGARTVGFLIGEAYGVPVGRIVPAKTNSKDEILRYLRQGCDIVAKADHPVSKDLLRLMLQSTLADRFKLSLHRETMTGPVYKLVVAKGGPKLQAAEDGGDLVMSGSPDGFTFRNAEVFRLAGYLSSYLDRMAVDESGLKGLYNFVVKMPEELRQSGSGKPEGKSPDSPSAAAFADVLKPLGLQLAAGMAPVEYLVVDHIEPPSDN